MQMGIGNRLAAAVVLLASPVAIGFAVEEEHVYFGHGVIVWYDEDYRSDHSGLAENGYQISDLHGIFAAGTTPSVECWDYGVSQSLECQSPSKYVACPSQDFFWASLWTDASGAVDGKYSYVQVSCGDAEDQ